MTAVLDNSTNEMKKAPYIQKLGIYFDFQYKVAIGQCGESEGETNSPILFLLFSRPCRHQQLSPGTPRSHGTKPL